MVRQLILSLVMLVISTTCTIAGFLEAMEIDLDPQPPTLTPTIMVARFATPTATGPATETPIPAPDSPLPTPTAARAVTVAATAEAEADETLLVAIRRPPNDDETPSPDTGNSTPEPTVTPEPDVVATPLPTETPTATPSPTPATLSGRIAFPVDNGGGRYDIWVVELPDGDPFFMVGGGRQPSFSNSGQLLVNNQDNQFGENLGWYDSNYSWLDVTGESPDDAFPYWHPDGSRFVFSNATLLVDPNTGQQLPYVFIPCSMRRPAVEQDGRCQDIRTYGKVAPGEFPVWTDDDRIVYFSYDGDDGIYGVRNASGLWQTGTSIPELIVTGNGRPSDTDGFQVFFSAGTIDQNWEAYAIDLDGQNLVNLSNSPNSQDGLPTVSPDGSWVAFVSDRDGLWGIWVVPREGGTPTKIVDFSTINTNPSPWGTGEREWTRERISWGP